MPCLFMRNIPARVSFDPLATRVLYERIAKATNVPLDLVEVHVENTKYSLLRADGTFSPTHGVHVFIEWFGGKGEQAKEEVAKAVQAFLVFHDIGEGSDTTFRDSPAGSFYYEGVRVAGGFLLKDSEVNTK